MAKTTKKDIYAKHGIEYDSKRGKVLSPMGWINPPLKNGNAKLGKGVWTFSMLATALMWLINFGTRLAPIWKEIMGTCSCTCEGCYACNGCYKFNSTKKCLATLTILAREYLEWLERCITAQIEADKIKICRVHASGDFVSDEYVEMWKRIAIFHKDTIFWTYTKIQKYENAFDNIANFNVVKSIIPNIGFNFGHCDYIISAYEALIKEGKSVYICKCGTDKNQHCFNCGACRKYEYVLFLEHGTDYKAEDDPLYPVLKGMIEAQDDIALVA